jgi:hypothetical protein
MSSSRIFRRQIAQCITATRGRKVDRLARWNDQTCCSISSILRRCAGRQRPVQSLRTRYPQSPTGTRTVRGRCLCQHQAEMGLDGMVNRCERSINVVTRGKPKMLRGLGQKGTGAGTGSCHYPVMDSQRSRRTESTSPIRVNLAERGKPVSLLL